MKTEDLSEVFTKEGINKLHRGQLLRFEYEGSMNEYIIVRLNKKLKIVIGKQVFTKDPDDVMIGSYNGSKQSFKDYELKSTQQEISNGSRKS